MTYMFYQQVGGEETWKCALASERERLVREVKPAFVTVLDVDNSFTSELSADDRLAVKYSGPFYVDFDGDLDEVLGQAKLFLVKLQSECNFDVDQARWYFTGGRGVHVEVPIEVLLPKVPRGGVPRLPAIYKEATFELYVDTVDMRVYSEARGRMWRTPNVQRDNDLYKVQVTSGEVMDATPETYRQICSAPRAPLPVTPPTFNPHLGLIYAQAADKVAAATKKRKARRTSPKIVEHYAGEWPGSVQLLMSGTGLKEELGWNQIAIQLASFALAIGKSEEQLVAACAELLENHAGDSSRYGTPRKRERELRNQYRYQDGNAAYEFSLGGIKSLYARGAYSADLDLGEMVPDENEGYGPPGGDGVAATEPAPAGEDADAALEAAIEKAEAESAEKLKIGITKSGIYVKGEDGWGSVSSAGLANPIRLRRLADGEILGYEVEVFVDRRPQGRHLLSISSVTSKANFQQWLSKFSASITAQEMIVPQIIDFLRLKTKRGANMITVSREGVDVIRPPTTPEDPKPRPAEIIFASSSEVKSTLGTPLRFRGQYDPDGAFKTDLWLAPDLQDTPENREYFDHLFEINSRLNVAKIFGWFVACFMCQPIRVAFKQFPSLQSWGQAGSGKSKTTEIFNHLHYWQVEPKKLSSTGSTFFPIMAAVTQSASIPVLFDEYKPREMSKHNKDTLTNVFRNNYEGGEIQRGALSKDAGPKEVVINAFANVAPIGFIGEAIESQSAIQERCVAVAFSKATRAGRARHFDYVFAKRHGGPLSELGKSLASSVMASSVADIAERVSHYKDALREKVGESLSDDIERPMFNTAVLLAALDMLKATLRVPFGSRYDAVVDELSDSLLERSNELLAATMSEAAKVLDVMAQLTRNTDLQFRLEKGQDYVSDGTHVDIRLKPAFAKYVRYRRSLGMEVLYDNEEAFIAGMSNYPGKTTDSCPDSPLFRSPFEKIFRFSCSHMEAEGLEIFEV